MKSEAFFFIGISLLTHKNIQNDEKVIFVIVTHFHTCFLKLHNSIIRL